MSYPTIPDLMPPSRNLVSFERKIQALFRSLLDTTNEDAFLGVFELFCHAQLPRNFHLRESMIRALQFSSSTSVALTPFAWYTRNLLLPPLPDEWHQALARACEGPKITNVILPNVQEDSLQLLKPRGMINDEIVNAYLHLLRRQGTLISTTKIINDTINGSVSAPMDLAVTKHSLSFCGQMFVPVHHQLYEHWSFVRIFNLPSADEITVEYYDSMDIPPPEFLWDWLERQFPGVKALYVLPEAPQQTPRSNDCGLFMLMGIRLMSAGSDHISETETRALIPPFRQQVLAEILAGKLNPTVEDLNRYLDEDAAAAIRATYESFPALELESSREHSPSTAEWADCVEEVVRLHLARSKPLLDAQTSLLPENPPVHKLRRTKKMSSLDFVNHCIETFADHKSMLKLLQPSVVTARATSFKTDKSLANLLQVIKNRDSQQNPLQHRYLREQYSRTFYQQVERLGGDPLVIEGPVRLQLQSILECGTDLKTWKSASYQAQKSIFWSEILNLFRPYLGSTPVALIGSAESVTALESLKKTEREALLSGLRQRMENPEDQLLANLKAAGALSQLVIEENLPSFTLAIERNPDLDIMDFEAAVSLESHLRLPD